MSKALPLVPNSTVTASLATLRKLDARAAPKGEAAAETQNNSRLDKNETPTGNKSRFIISRSTSKLKLPELVLETDKVMIFPVSQQPSPTRSKLSPIFVKPKERLISTKGFKIEPLTQISPKKGFIATSLKKMAKQTSTSLLMSPIHKEDDLGTREELESREKNISSFGRQASQLSPLGNLLRTPSKGGVDKMLTPLMTPVSSKSKAGETASTANSSDNPQVDSTVKLASKLVVRKRPQKQPDAVLDPPTPMDDHRTLNQDHAKKARDYFLNHLRSLKWEAHAPPQNKQFSTSNQLDVGHYMDNNLRVMNMMKFDSIVERGQKAAYQRKYPNRKLLLLDLDETLIHCSGDPSLKAKFDMELDFVTNEGVNLKGYLNVRPYARQFLRSMSVHFEVVIFTASLQYYADRILKVLDPQRLFISHVFYRETCSKTRFEKFVKDLSVFTGTPMDEMIMVDNNMYCLWPQPQNGVPILNFEFDRSDTELEKLEAFLVNYIKDHHHPTVLRDYFKLHEISACSDLNEYLSLFSL